MKKVLFLWATAGVLGRTVGTDDRLSSAVKLLDVPSCRKSPCPSVWRATLRTEPDNKKYMTGSKQLLKADSKSTTSFVRSTICRV